MPSELKLFPKRDQVLKKNMFTLLQNKISFMKTEDCSLLRLSYSGITWYLEP